MFVKKKKVQHELTVNHETNVILWDSRIGIPILRMHHSKIGQNLLNFSYMVKSNNGPPFTSEEIKEYKH